jgi:hypothetical protein
MLESPCPTQRLRDAVNSVRCSNNNYPLKSQSYQIKVMRKGTHDRGKRHQRVAFIQKDDTYSFPALLLQLLEVFL